MRNPTTMVKRALNYGLSFANLRIETRLEEKEELTRLRRLEVQGLFDAPLYPLPDPTPIVEELRAADERTRADLDNLLAGDSATGYLPDNPWFTPADAGVLYLLLRSRAPRLVVEVGCGNSTVVTRQAIRDGRLTTRMEAIDPQPRREISDLVDRLHRCRLEEVPTAHGLFNELQPGDVLFIDSSHEARIGGDVAQLFLRVLPNLPAGVLVHVHDIFLPYEYPRDLVFEQRIGWSEQYLLHAFLTGADHRIIWPGYFLQQDRKEDLQGLPFMSQGRAQSFWIEIGQGPQAA